MFYWQTNCNKIMLLTRYCWERKENSPMDNCQEIMKAWKLSDFCSDAHTIHILCDIFCHKSFNVVIFWNLYFLVSFTLNLRQHVLVQSVLKKRVDLPGFVGVPDLLNGWFDGVGVDEGVIVLIFGATVVFVAVVWPLVLAMFSAFASASY